MFLFLYAKVYGLLFFIVFDKTPKKKEHLKKKRIALLFARTFTADWIAKTTIRSRFLFDVHP